MRKEFFSERSFDTIEELQEALDIWVADYNNEREHQSLGDVPSIRSFELARPASLELSSATPHTRWAEGSAELVKETAERAIGCAKELPAGLEAAAALG